MSGNLFNDLCISFLKPYTFFIYIYIYVYMCVFMRVRLIVFDYMLVLLLLLYSYPFFCTSWVRHKVNLCGVWQVWIRNLLSTSPFATPRLKNPVCQLFTHSYIFIHTFLKRFTQRKMQSALSVNWTCAVPTTVSVTPKTFAIFLRCINVLFLQEPQYSWKRARIQKKARWL